MNTILFLRSINFLFQNTRGIQKAISYLGDVSVQVHQDCFSLSVRLDDFESERQTIEQLFSELKDIGLPLDTTFEVSLSEVTPDDAEEEAPPFFEATAQLGDFLSETFWEPRTTYSVQIKITPALSGGDFKSWSLSMSASFPNAKIAEVSNGVEVFGARATLPAQPAAHLPPIQDLLKASVAIAQQCNIAFENINIFANDNYDISIYRSPNGSISIREPSGRIVPWNP